jgi:hypothetical protein
MLLDHIQYDSLFQRLFYDTPEQTEFDLLLASRMEPGFDL